MINDLTKLAYLSEINYIERVEDVISFKGRFYEGKYIRNFDEI